MSRKLICIIITCAILFTAFIPLARADEITMYASDGRSIQVKLADKELWKAVGWYETYEDAKIITMYAMDGRTLSIPQYYRSAHNAVGWYNTREEVVQTMYSMDGRTLEVYKDAAAAHNAVGWYYNLSDVTVTMYDIDANEYMVYKDHIAEKIANGLYLNKSDVTQLMFSADGRFIQVPFSKVEDYLKVGWYRAGGKIDPTRPMVAITFDDGPGRYTDKVVSILEKYNVKATFFVQGHSVSGYASVLKRAASLGNEIGNHTWNHVNLANSSTGTISSQISSTNNAIYNATGVYPKLYRPPYGSYNRTVLNCIPMGCVMWSVDTLDWKTRSASQTLASVKRDTTDGAIILMHDIHSPTADAVEPVVKHLLMSGYQLVTVSELITARQGSVVNGKVYTKVSP